MGEAQEGVVKEEGRQRTMFLLAHENIAPGCLLDAL